MHKVLLSLASSAAAAQGTMEMLCFAIHTNLCHQIRWKATEEGKSAAIRFDGPLEVKEIKR